MTMPYLPPELMNLVFSYMESPTNRIMKAEIEIYRGENEYKIEKMTENIQIIMIILRIRTIMTLIV